jgi:hypothetical protein
MEVTQFLQARSREAEHGIATAVTVREKYLLQIGLATSVLVRTPTIVCRVGAILGGGLNTSIVTVRGRGRLKPIVVIRIGKPSSPSSRRYRFRTYVGVQQWCSGLRPNPMRHSA